MLRTELGRITSAKFGYGGYQEAMLGLTIALGGKSWGTGDFRGAWAMEPSDNAKWTVAERNQSLADACLFLRDLLRAAGKQDVSELAGVPIEATFEGLRLHSWRILTEVL